MARVCELKADRDTEIWGADSTKPGCSSGGTLAVDDPAVSWPDLRLTVDTPLDFELVTRIFDDLYQPGKVFPLRDIVAFCRDRPDLASINAAVQQKAGPPARFKEAASENA